MNQKELELMGRYVNSTKDSNHLRRLAFQKILKFEETFIPMKRETPTPTGNSEYERNPSVKKKRKLNFDRKSTVTVAIPGSILEQRRKNILRENLVTQIARSCSIFRVDEIVVYNEYATPIPVHHFASTPQKRREGCFDPNVQTANILYFLDCPPFLRAHAFPILPELNYCGTYSPLITPNHLNSGKYREGVYVGNSTMFIGDRKKFFLKEEESRNLIVEKKYTLELEKETPNGHFGKVVKKLDPRTKNGTYFGYDVRLAESLSKIWSECPFDGGYDVTVGTSVQGDSIDKEGFDLPLFRHLLIAFGSPKNGLTVALESDKNSFKFREEKEIFNLMVNVCPNQGTKTIRTEEAVTIALSALRPYVQTNRTPSRMKRPFIPLKTEE